MAGLVITPEQLPAEITKIMNEFCLEAIEGVQRAGRKTARETSKMVNASASSMIHGRRGIYEKSWTQKVTLTRTGIEAVVYSKQPGLPHLLEDGHSITYLAGNKNKGPGWSPAKPHIAIVDAQVPDMFEANIRKEIDKL